MKLFPVTLMFLAWLLYGAMPAMASFPIDMPVNTASAQSEHAGHDMADMAKAVSTPTDDASGDPCPHRGGMKHVAFCAACLVLPPFVDVSTLASPVFPMVKPGLIRALVATIPAPPERPPRV